MALTVTGVVTVLAGVAGNLLIPKAALEWFRGLPRPRWLVPFPVFIAVGVVYYPLMATVLYRALDRQDLAAVAATVVVIIANEAWNAVFFGLRSTLGGFLGILAFAVPLAVSIVLTRTDAVSLVLLALYALWVIYDIAWTFALWRGEQTITSRERA